MRNTAKKLQLSYGCTYSVKRSRNSAKAAMM